VRPVLAPQGRAAEVRDLLGPVYGWFIEGFGTSDLRDAKALLDELADNFSDVQRNNAKLLGVTEFGNAAVCPQEYVTNRSAPVRQSLSQGAVRWLTK